MNSSNADNIFLVGEMVFVRDDAMSTIVCKCDCEDDCGEWCGTAGD